jgi:hypothetical protein
MTDVITSQPRIIDYPAVFGVAVVVLCTALLVYVASKFDPTGGALTISLIVVLAFAGVVGVVVFHTIPVDEATAGVIGGLTAAMGAVVTHWLGRSPGPPPAAPPDDDQPSA